MAMHNYHLMATGRLADGSNKIYTYSRVEIIMLVKVYSAHIAPRSPSPHSRTFARARCVRAIRFALEFEFIHIIEHYIVLAYDIHNTYIYIYMGMQSSA